MTDRLDVFPDTWRDRGVCIISPYPTGGIASQSGVALYTQSLVDGFSRCKTPPIVVLAQRSAPVLEGKYFRVLPIWDAAHFSGRRIGRSLAVHRPRVIHLQHEFRIFGTVAKTAATVRWLRWVRSLDTGVVITLHGVVSASAINRGFISRNQTNLPSAIVRQVFKRAHQDIRRLSDQVIVHHQYFADILVRDYSYNPKQINVIPFGRDVETHDSAQIIRSSSSSEFRVLCFGYLTSYKNFELVLDVAERSTIPGVKFVFCVSERLAEKEKPSVRFIELEKRARELEGVVEWHGYLADKRIPEIFSSADLLLLPYTDCVSVSGVASLAEGFGIPICHSEPLSPLLGFGNRTFKLDAVALEGAIARAMAGSLTYSDSEVYKSWDQVACMTRLAWDRAGRIDS